MNQNPIMSATLKALQDELAKERDELAIKPFGFNTEAPTLRQSHSYIRGHEAASARLLGLLEKAVELLEFYGSVSNWSNDNPEHPIENDAGDIAREFLSSLKDPK
jgi:cytochrome oxidase Cu insertion factor (SCO1/SenC/PrrC family)